VHLGRSGALATASRRHGGHPFGSVMPYAPDPNGAPLLLISALAMHTQNLQADPRASLLVTAPTAAEDVLAAGRATLLGAARRLADADAAAARGPYLARHPSAESWVDFGDFAFWRLDVRDVYFVGGFGAMGWIAGDEYGQASPDPLAEAAPDILEHMNRDHADALVLLVRAFGPGPVDEARMTSVDRFGFTARVRAGERLSSARIAFPREITTPEDSRTILIEMLRDARSRVAT
jgi:hypothetical protein